MTTPEQQPILHYWNTKPASLQMTAKDILELHIAVSRVLTPATKAVIENHLESQTPIILEGDYLLPELLADQEKYSRVRAVFLYEPDEQQLAKNFLAREPDEGEQSRAHVSWLFGKWLRAECERYGLPAIRARPWETPSERILEAIY